MHEAFALTYGLLWALVQFSDQIMLVVVCLSKVQDCGVFRDRLDPHIPLFADPDAQIGALFGMRGDPSAIVIGSDRRVRAYAQPRTVEELESFILSAARAEMEILAGQGAAGIETGQMGSSFPRELRH